MQDIRASKVARLAAINAELTALYAEYNAEVEAGELDCCMDCSGWSRLISPLEWDRDILEEEIEELAQVA